MGLTHLGEVKGNKNQGGKSAEEISQDHNESERISLNLRDDTPEERLPQESQDPPPIHCLKVKKD